MYYNNENFFFGEEFRTFGIHVVQTAWIFSVVDLSLIFLLSGLLNLTIGRFDTFSILFGFIFLAVLACAVYGLVVRRYIYLWPLLVCKAAEAVITVIMLLISLSLLLFERKLLIHVISMRLTTLEGENVSTSKEQAHILLAFLYLFCQLAYSLLLLYVFFSAMDYLKKRTLFAYRQRMEPTHDFISRISSVRHFTRSLSPEEKEEKMLIEEERVIEDSSNHILPPHSPEGLLQSVMESLNGRTQGQSLPPTMEESFHSGIVMYPMEGSYHEGMRGQTPQTIHMQGSFHSAIQPSYHPVPPPRGVRTGGRQASVPLSRYPVEWERQSVPVHDRQRSYTMGDEEDGGQPMRRRSTTNERHVTFQEVFHPVEERRSSIPFQRTSIEMDPSTIRSLSVPYSDRSDENRREDTFDYRHL